MEAYTGFAQVYDLFMDNIPYHEWSKYLIELLKKHGVQDGIVLDLGCGTGNITIELSKNGYDMIGIDNSIDMLSIAREKSADKNKEILYLHQDMREFELYGTVKAAVSICDSINYIMSDEELMEVFKLVNNYLDPNGIFIFDFNTEYKYKNILSDNIIAENREAGSFIWENYYYEEEMVNEYELTIFLKHNEDEELYKKYVETHYQKAYTLNKIKKLINKSGLEFVQAYDAFTYDNPTNKSERIYIIAREKGKAQGE